jgi:hypothetical protein
MNFIFMTTYECVACGNSGHLSSQGTWLLLDASDASKQGVLQ